MPKIKILKSFFFLTFLTFVTSLPVFAADNGSTKGKGQIGITFSSFGSNDLLSFRKTVGGPGYRGNGFFTLGLSYLYPLNKTFDFETGLEYSEHKFLIEPNLPLIYGGISTHDRFSLISIPATIRLNFMKYFFLKGGLFLGFGGGNSTSVENQNGIGLNLGLGIKYNLNSKLSIFVNPYAKVHSIIPFTSVGGEGRLVESGFKIGILVRLNCPVKAVNR